jgi:DNA polymerase III subunit gamma/tau
MLYNSYRPVCLNEVIGHEKIIKALTKRSKENDIPKRILFTGITGTGKTTLMRIIGKNILCNNKDKEGNSCNTCDICKAIDNEQMNSFFLENNASNLNIEEVRKLVQDAEVKSFSQAKAKVFVIDEIQEMTKAKAALNNLLKPLEKEYKNVYFILGTMSPKDVPKSIGNRCTTYDLKPISIDDISKQLYNICSKENIKIDTEEKANVLITIADNSYGSMRTAISYLERVIDSGLWTVSDVIKELDLISNNDLVQSINNLFQAKSEAFNIQYTEELIKKFRYMLGTIYKQLSGIEVPKWQLDQLKGVDKSIQINQVQYALEKLLELNKYPYVNQELIDYVLVDIFNNIKQNVLSKKLIEQHKDNVNIIPKRRGE